MDRGSVETAVGREPERFAEAGRGDAHWFTLFSGERTATSGMSAGVMVLPPGGWLAAHRHAQAEIYYVAAGGGTVSIDGVERALAAGEAAFIPGDALHSLRNAGTGELRVFYVFPTDRFSEVVYRFEGG